MSDARCTAWHSSSGAWPRLLALLNNLGGEEPVELPIPLADAVSLTTVAMVGMGLATLT